MQTAPATEAPTIEVTAFNGVLAQGLLRRDGISQTQVAKRWGKSEALVSRMMSGDRPIPYHLLVDLAVTVKLDPSALATVRVACPRCDAGTTP